MSGPDRAVAATRVAVRRWLTRYLRPTPSSPRPAVLVACSGGADSLALAAAVAFEGARLARRGDEVAAGVGGLVAGAVVVDHGLQPDSAQVAATAAGQCRELGLDPVWVVPVRVPDATGQGPEAAARQARYAAFAQIAATVAGAPVLLGHTRDDQAEQVLLGLLRGSGARSLAGMPPARDGVGRPFLGLTRATTEAACRALGLHPWLDPHNVDPRFLRARIRALLAAAEQDVGPGLGAALARSADLLRLDADALDEQAAVAAAALGSGPWQVGELTAIVPAVRRRVWRLLAAGAGCPPGRVAAVHVDGLDALLTDWRGQGPVALPGGRQGRRLAGRLSITGGQLPAAGPAPR